MKWNTWREFGTTMYGNWIHSANMAFMAFQIDALWREDPRPRPPPRIRVRAEVSEIERGVVPELVGGALRHPARGKLPPVKVHWYNDLRTPGFRETLEPLMQRKMIIGGSDPWLDHAGCLVVGSQGTIHSTGHNSTYTLLPKEKFADYKKPEPTLPRSGSHEREWTRACRGGPAAMANFEYGALLTEFALLANVATQFDRAIEFDPVGMQCVGDAEATAALKREHRAGWTL